MTDGITDFPNLATERIVPPSALDVEQLEVLCDAVAASWALPESVVFDHQLKLGGEQRNEPVGHRIVCSLSGWFRLHDVRYHEEVRPVSQIATADWSALLDHADAIDFFDRPEPAPAGPSDRIFHLTITAGNRHRELAINDPFETPELAHLITLTRRAVRDRQVLSPEMLDDEQFAALATAWLDAQAADSDDGPGR